MYLETKHRCGSIVAVPCIEEIDAYMNPSWCPTCQVKFFAQPPEGLPPSEKDLKRRADKWMRFNEALAKIALMFKGEAHERSSKPRN